MNKIDGKKIRAGYQPIPGYTLEEIVGRGGFGEVWRADAPGGLKKAVKFVFGAHDQTRASRELRSLERIRGVHHPFLLTLERFEVVDDQLVIVTELADGSLEDVLKRHRDHGSCGIPRESLISHLHDAADALDYLHQSYQLQHLDIKPGNLLIVGGHVKVADFGLLKDLTEIECSVVGGLTPIYAPPEVFDGRPSMHSDQYSLAVMYQELLTGTRPFSGRTIAQLATQHVHSAPNLESLPASDRPVVARALEKSPDRRFPNCKAFVDALRNPRSRTTVVTGFGEDHHGEGTHAGLPDQQVGDLPQLNRDSGNDHCVTNHAMVVALGGTGADCLRDLRSRVSDLHAACQLDLHGILIDTDIETIHSMRVAEASERVPPCQTIHIPLRTAHQYRESGTDRLKTISRRWIYNVPRSTSTEGMRPLGRLALVDHGHEVIKSLTEAVDRLSKSSIDKTPTVYVIGSLAGGTASGIYLDVVHMLRHLLDEARLEDTRIISMLTTAELRADPAAPLALHDTQAAMIEMQHFMRPGNGYPGDIGAGFHSVPAARTPLHNVYLVAASPRGTCAPSPARTITDYVWSDATGGGELLAEARRLQSDDSDSQLRVPCIRSVGVVSLGTSRSLEEKLLVPAAVRQLLIGWLGLPSEARRAAAPLTDRLMRRCAISKKAFVSATANLLGSSESQRSERVSLCLSASGDDECPADMSVVEQEVGDLLRRRCLQKNADVLVETVLTNLYRELAVYLHDRRADVTTVIESLKLIANTAREAASTPNGADEQSSTLDESSIVESEPGDIHLQILERQAEQVAAERLARLCERLDQLRERFETFATTLATAIVHRTPDQENKSSRWDDMPAEIRQHFEPTLVELHQLAASRWLLLPLGNCPLSSADAVEMVNGLSEDVMPIVSKIVDQNNLQSRNETELSLSSTAPDKTVTLQIPGGAISAHDSTIITQSIAPGSLYDSHVDEEQLPVDAAIDAVRPALLSCGGLQRLILVVGTESERDQLEPQVRAAHPGALTVVLIPGSAPKLIHEAQKIEIEQVLTRLSKLNGGNGQVTSRLVTRTDVAWQSSKPTR